MPIVWQRPDGSLIIERVAPQVVERERQVGESTEQVVLRIATNMLRNKEGREELIGLSPIVIKEVELPPSREFRYKWRLDGATVKVDTTIPDRIDPRAQARTELARATTIAELKAALLKLG